MFVYYFESRIWDLSGTAVFIIAVPDEIKLDCCVFFGTVFAGQFRGLFLAPISILDGNFSTVRLVRFIPRPFSRFR